jgi:hypothetical protein
MQNSKGEVKQLLAEAGHPELFTEENYRIATTLTKYAEKHDPMLRQHFKNAEGFREMYKRDLIIKNCLKK